MSKKALRKACQKELAMALRTKRGRKDRPRDNESGSFDQPQVGYDA
ncbi:hypothetical protein pEaSNUABM56_00218 [Erwinia phage pEa_SNUABM_56]|uniref:Uncharacterized protein n=1 Tax=Erwinia phage pEp_SNUABM_01 TaxID=2601643 RepID=A0A5J6DBG0_9CAUD|nr:hypothetical protein HWC63_gp185 [Erwinia phage pEp_SNUABM_01]QEQ94993.1 hypothetical protein pEpSNUABM01_167 [Erwinia phage pEp_SNUABM_01]UYL84919.1 hypothetical protein pEaSNUABM55_00146 [Erwinia phage pEa_SNUABM_55]UYL85238.1 hypothetical protein pEaSNUABM56_00218 [Erwinia phage pEa_SNUABM_56]